MMSEDNRLLPLSNAERAVDRPLREIPLQKSYGASSLETTHLREYMQVVLKRKWLILSLMLVVTSLVAVQMYRQPSIYQAATTVLIEQKPQSVLQTKEVVINTQSDPNYWNTQLRLLENPQLARQVVLTLDLQNNPAFFSGQSQKGILTSIRKIFSRNRNERPTTVLPAAGTGLPVVSETEVKGQQLTAEQLAQLEPYEDAIAAGLSVEPVVGTNLVTLQFKHTDPVLAQKVVNTLADVFVYNNLERMTSGSEKSSDLLARQIADLQFKIKQGEEVRLNYARNHNLPQTSEPGGNISAERLATYSKQLLEAENDRKNHQSEYEAAVREPDKVSIPQVQEDKRTQSLREKRENLLQKRAELLVTYTPEWPGVKRIDEQLKPVEEALNKAPREIISGLKTRFEAALARENRLRQSYNEQLGITNKQNQDEIQISVLKQDLETNKQYYNTLLQRQRELQITSNDKPNNVSVATYSRVPGAPIGPPRLRNIVIAFLLSLAAGIGLAFLLDYLDDTLKSVEDVDRYLHLPVLALIPSTRSERLRIKGGRAAATGSVEASTALALIEDVRSPVAEAYRHLRTSLLLSSAGQPPKSIVVTSSQPSEGKTTTAINTAVMLAQTGAEVLIVDCDLRRPRIHAHFGVSNVNGVTNYLSGEKDIDALLHSYDKLPNLKLMTSGPVPPNPAELLGSDEMRKLINLLGERFTHIIIDSPPAISFTDASVLSTMVDGVMLVIHGGRSSRAVVRRAKQQLMDVGAHIFGVVLNNVKLESQDYYYYGGYYASYYASAEDDDAAAADAHEAR